VANREVIEKYGRPVRARTAGLHRVNCVVRKLNPFACLAFPFLTISKIPIDGLVLVTTGWRVFASSVQRSPRSGERGDRA